jgi:hypothetical protein
MLLLETTFYDNFGSLGFFSQSFFLVFCLMNRNTFTRVGSVTHHQSISSVYPSPARQFSLPLARVSVRLPFIRGIVHFAYHLSITLVNTLLEYRFRCSSPRACSSPFTIVTVWFTLQCQFSLTSQESKFRLPSTRVLFTFTLHQSISSIYPSLYVIQFQFTHH